MDSGMENFPGIERMTPSLNEAKNDTGRMAFCGPYVLSAITGFPISKIEDDDPRRPRAAARKPS